MLTIVVLLVKLICFNTIFPKDMIPQVKYMGEDSERQYLGTVRDVLLKTLVKLD